MEPMTRTDLIKYIEDKKLKKVLRQKVIDKWEDIEASITVNRSAKFGEDD